MKTIIEMKSCRNCQIATHDGYFYVRLICGLNKRVIVPFSANFDENKQADAHAQRIAKCCSAYKPQGK